MRKSLREHTQKVYFSTNYYYTFCEDFGRIVNDRNLITRDPWKERLTVSGKIFKGREINSYFDINKKCQRNTPHGIMWL